MITFLALKPFLNSISRNSNPAYTVDELAHQLRLTNATTIVVHSQCLKNATEACKDAGLPPERIVIIDQATFDAPHVTVEQLIQDGLAHNVKFVERKLGPGEGKSKIAFLCLSSGTTGPPKVAHRSLRDSPSKTWIHRLWPYLTIR